MHHNLVSISSNSELVKFSNQKKTKRTGKETETTFKYSLIHTVGVDMLSAALWPKYVTKKEPKELWFLFFSNFHHFASLHHDRYQRKQSERN